MMMKTRLPGVLVYRMSKEEIIYNWLQYVAQIARQHFIMLGKPDPGAKLFQYPFPDQVWVRVFCFIDAQGGLVVLSHGAIKKTQKADPQEVDRAIRLKRQYEAAQKEGSIQLVELD